MPIEEDSGVNCHTLNIEKGLSTMPKQPYLNEDRAAEEGSCEVS